MAGGGLERCSISQQVSLANNARLVQKGARTQCCCELTLATSNFYVLLILAGAAWLPSRRAGGRGGCPCKHAA
eukprot:1147821-Pelagomonas_calceolata.AAC.1